MFNAQGGGFQENNSSTYQRPSFSWTYNAYGASSLTVVGQSYPPFGNTKINEAAKGVSD